MCLAMGSVAPMLLAAVALALASITDGAITSVALHRKNAQLDHVASRSDRNVVCAPRHGQLDLIP
jgi:heme exporter protein D